MSVGGYLALAIAGGLGMYLGAAAIFWLAYYRRRADAPVWKLQPARWPSRRQRRRELALGCANMTLGSIASGLFAHHVATGGASSIYWRGHGALFSIATAIVYFVATDGLLYGAHRMLHRKTLFRWIHREHHRATAPTVLTAPAMHPAEFALYQAIMLAPLFVWPIHVVGLIVVLVYQNTIALLDHSGVALGSVLPWQPPPRFHDDHHVHFHVNFGQTLGLWDRAFGTWRRTGRVYGEAVYGGKGAPVGPGGESAPPRRVEYR